MIRFLTGSDWRVSRPAATASAMVLFVLASLGADALASPPSGVAPSLNARGTYESFTRASEPHGVPHDPYLRAGEAGRSPTPAEALFRQGERDFANRHDIPSSPSPTSTPAESVFRQSERDFADRTAGGRSGGIRPYAV